jgi:hypothetical protein
MTTTAFDAYLLPEEHVAVREADETGEFPKGVV